MKRILRTFKTEEINNRLHKALKTNPKLLLPSHKAFLAKHWLLLLKLGFPFSKPRLR